MLKNGWMPFLIGVVVGWILIPMIFASPLGRKGNGRA